MNATLQRLQTILDMVPWLLANPGAPLDEVAARFGSTPQAVADDLDLLGYCGVPGYGGGDLVETSVVDGCVTVRMADFFSRPLRLGPQEAITLLVAGRTLLAVPGSEGSAPLRRAVQRLEELLGAADVAVDLGPVDSDMLQQIADAVGERRLLQISYRSTGSEQQDRREVEPWALLAAGGYWYLRGRCRAARDRRDFRLDRIKSLHIQDERVGPAPDGATDDPPGYTPSPDDVEVVLEADEGLAWLVEHIPGAQAEGGRVRFRSRSVEWAARLVLGLAGSARVVEPPALRARVSELAQGALRRYSAPGQSPTATAD